MALNWLPKISQANKQARMKDEAVFGSILITSDGRICVVQGKSSLKWSFPKGHCREGETPFQCAKRETAEETGIQIPWQTYRPIKLAVGYYYVIFVAKEFPRLVFDANEICQVDWVTVDELRAMNVNIDINNFLRKLKSVGSREPLWQLIERRISGHGFGQKVQTCVQGSVIAVN